MGFLQIISLTTLVVKYTGKGTDVCMAGLAKRGEVRFRKNAGALLKKTIRFSMYRFGSECVLTAPNDVLPEKCTVLFLIAFTILKIKYLSPNSHAWYSPVTQFALPETKHKETPSKQSLPYSKSNFKQASSVFVHSTVRFLLVMMFIVK